MRIFLELRQERGFIGHLKVARVNKDNSMRLPGIDASPKDCVADQGLERNRKLPANRPTERVFGMIKRKPYFSKSKHG